MERTNFQEKASCEVVSIHKDAVNNLISRCKWVDIGENCEGFDASTKRKFLSFGRWMCGIETRSREDFIKFLVDDEGLKSSHELMEKWIDSSIPYQSTHSNLFIGPLKKDQWDYAKSVTFFVNPDQLSTLIIGAQYKSSPEDPTPVIAPFGSGCMELLPFKDLNTPQAAIGATDIAMRKYLSPDILTLSVTKPMFKQLCELDERSFLYKGFLQNLRRARGLLEL